jgi:hypothetical protein
VYVWFGFFTLLQMLFQLFVAAVTATYVSKTYIPQFLLLNVINYKGNIMEETYPKTMQNKNILRIF